MNAETRIPTVAADGRIRVAIHCSPWHCASGLYNTHWSEYHVVAGRDPLGPRGGCSGWWMDAEVIGGRCRTRAAAEALAKAYCAAHPDAKMSGRGGPDWNWK